MWNYVADRTPAYLRKKYVLFNLTMEAKLLQNGIRSYIVQQMKGRLIEGSVVRAFSDEYGQHLILFATAEPEALDKLEDHLIYDGRYWSDFDDSSPAQPRNKLSHGNFMICQSHRRAECGPNSDADYDNKSEISSQKSK